MNFYAPSWDTCKGDREFFLHRAHGGPSPNPSPVGRGVICEVTPIGLLTRFLGSSFSHRAHRVHWAFLRTFRAHRTPPAYRVHRALLLKVAVRFCEIGWLNVSVEYRVFCSSVLSVRKRTSLRLAGEFFLSQSAQSSRSFLAHISSPQNAFGIQSSQSVTANEDTNKEAKSSLHPANRGISVITPLPFGGGAGGGATIFLTPVFFCHYVIMSKNTHLSSFVIMSFCLKTHICLLLSLCHSVLKKLPVSLCHYVIMS